MASVLEPMRIVDGGHQSLSRLAPHAGDRHHTLNLWVVFGELFESIFDRLHLHGQVVELREFQIEFTFPEFIRITISDRLAKTVDVLSSEAPCPFAGVDLDAAIGEQ